MLKFFKELIASAKEGIEEGRAELAAEAAAKDATVGERRTRMVERLAAASDYERFAVALGAPYRQVFSTELRDARAEERPAAGLECIELPSMDPVEWRSLLDRDFSIVDADSAREVLAGITAHVDEYGPHEIDAAALWIVRGSYAAGASAALGYLGDDEALGWMRAFVLRALREHADWAGLGASFLRGESQDAASNFLGRKVLASAVATLSKDDLSPWANRPWPARDSLSVPPAAGNAA